MSKIEQRIVELGLELPPPAPAVANYVPAVQSGSHIYVAGHGPWSGDKFIFLGKLDRDLDIATAYQAARLVMLNCLSSVKAVVDDLDRVRRIVKVLGMVNSMPDFVDQAKVINGASDLLESIFGPAGRHARSAVGMASLPAGISVEIEMIAEID